MTRQEQIEQAEKLLEQFPPSVRARASARTMAKIGARKGGKARASKLSPEERRRIAHRGGRARWGLPPDDKKTA